MRVPSKHHGTLKRETGIPVSSVTTCTLALLGGAQSKDLRQLMLAARSQRAEMSQSLSVKPNQHDWAPLEASSRSNADHRMCSRIEQLYV
ncbi:hypothetical protein FH972_023916 [Carpinus fangiana]|uniref:Uncharacterized protein n=1 Tax=Carpinus fangiana TaxID=176857 RepID=A0A5N6KXC2_9ROSI|nr:hypothetical protein FH972_023916 [Carpinus fangiana]